ncbi:acyl-CoA dehydrogenase family protein [Streptomyces sp. NPDC005303]|uniref:acyl-CoA dehydrogenase family protein n=1 Tax=Streptomyces sp. NPDC005303 TaxID=3155713 RepID=UPI0033B1C39A
MELKDASLARTVTRDAGRVLRHVMDQACTALAAEQVGAAQRCLDLTVANAKDRVQFGRAIGSFQAVPEGVRPVVGDATDTETVASLAEGADVLVLTVGGPDARLYTDAVATAAAVRASAPRGRASCTWAAGQAS